MNIKQLPQNWKEVELKDLFIFESKSGRKAGEGSEKGKYKFFTSSSQQSKFIDEYNFEGEHLIFSTGGRAGIHYCNEKFSASNDCFVVRVINKVITKYIYYFLSERIYILEEGFKGAGLRHLSRNYLSGIKIIYPEEKEIQKQIVSILEKVEKLKEKREHANNLTKEYLQSVFYEMFGNPTINSKKWPIKSIQELALDRKGSIRIGPFGSQLKKNELVNEGIKVLWIENIVDNNFNTEGIRYITKEKYEQLKGFTVNNGDLIITMMGTIGRVGIVPDIGTAIISSHLLKIEINKNICDPIYLKKIIMSPFVQNQFKDASHGAIMSGLNGGIIKSTKIPLPPIELQQKFASIVENVEKLKEKQKQSKKEINIMFNSLMQKAFNGELVK